MVSLTTAKVVAGPAKPMKETVALLRTKKMIDDESSPETPTASDLAAVDQSRTNFGFKHAHANLPVTPGLNLLFGGMPGVVLNPMMIIELPLVVMLMCIYRMHFRWRLMPVMFALYLWKECVPMSAVLHRYFSHKGYRCSRPMQAGLYVLGCLASQGPPLWWASKHRRHHAHCDTKKDPHSPVTKSFLQAWMGWVFLPGEEGPLGAGVDEEWIQDLMKFPELVVGENIYWVFPLLSHIAFYAYGGLGHALFVSALSGVLCQVLTLYFNAMFHRMEEHESHIRTGEMDDATGKEKLVVCKAIDLPFDVLSNVFGEAFHSWHHLYPRAYKRPGLDLPYWTFILPLKKLGMLSGENIMAKSKVV